MKAVLAVDVGGTYIKYGKIEPDQKISMSGKVKTPKTRKLFFQALHEIQEKAGGCMKDSDIEGAAFSMAGVINTKKGTVSNIGAVSYLRGLDFSQMFFEKSGLKNVIENDAKAAVYGELCCGSLRNVKNGVALIIGTNVGGGIVAEGNLLRGAHGAAGEFSYIYNMAGINGRDMGRECGVRGMLQEVGLFYPEKDLDGEKVFKLIREGNQAVERGVRRYCRKLCYHICNLQAVLDPEVFAIGGGISSEPLFLSLLKEEMDEYYTQLGERICKPVIKACQLKNDANLIGAYLCYRKVYGKENERNET